MESQARVAVQHGAVDALSSALARQLVASGSVHDALGDDSADIVVHQSGFGAARDDDRA
jgi:hypothetical protein